MTDSKEFHLFEVFGVELEYMLVQKNSLDILSKVDELLKAADGDYTTDHVEGNIGWANELALHVMEIRNDVPDSHLEGLAEQFLTQITKANTLAKRLDGKLMPGSMHPWMNPAREAKLWPHEYHEIYEQFDKVFNCRRHGWANLQSCQLNLPFSGDAEFEKLHAAIRFLLPLLPGLASSSPIAECQKSNFLNYRLHVYKENAQKTPLVAGDCIPEPIYTKKSYQTELLPKIFEQIKPFDPEGNLQYEWLNARGAIARFDRNAIEIRILDMQENPFADISICLAIVAVLKRLCADHFAPIRDIKQWPVAPLKEILEDHKKDAGDTVIRNRDYLKSFGLKCKDIQSKELWEYLIFDQAGHVSNDKIFTANLRKILKEGVLAKRILKATGENFSKASLHEVYGELCACLAEGRMFNV